MSGASFVDGLMRGYAFTDQAFRNHEYDKAAGESRDEVRRIRDTDKQIAESLRQGYENGDGQGYGFRQVDMPAVDDNGEASAAGLKPVYKDERTDNERYLDGYNAAHRKAIELGRPDIAEQAFIKTASLRHQTRSDALTKAMGNYQMTGDFNAFVPFFNRYAQNGEFVKAIEKVPGQDGKGDGYRIVGSRADGTPLPSEPLTEDALMGRFQWIVSPEGAMAAEARYRQELNAKLRDAQIDTAKQVAVERAKNPVVKMEADANYYDPTSGRMVQQAGLKPQIVTTPEGSTSMVVGGAGGGGRVIAGGPDDPGALTKKIEARLDKAGDVMGSVFKNLETSGVPSPQVAAMRASGQGHLSNIIRANPEIDAAQAGQLAALLAQKQIKQGSDPKADPTKEPVILRGKATDDPSGPEFDYIQMPGGQKVVLDLQASKALEARARRRSAGSEAGPKSDTAKEPPFAYRGDPSNASTAAAAAAGNRKAQAEGTPGVLRQEFRQWLDAPPSKARDEQLASLEKQLKALGNNPDDVAAGRAGRLGLEPAAKPSAPAAPTPENAAVAADVGLSFAERRDSALARANASAAAERAVRQSPAFRTLEAQRVAAIKRGDTRAVTAAVSQQRAMLDAGLQKTVAR